MDGERELQTIGKEDAGAIDGAMFSDNSPLKLGVGNTAQMRLLDMRASNKQLARITSEGELIIDATDAELEAVIQSNWELKAYAILLLEISKLRKKVNG